MQPYKRLTEWNYFKSVDKYLVFPQKNFPVKNWKIKSKNLNLVTEVHSLQCNSQWILRARKMKSLKKKIKNKKGFYFWGSGKKLLTSKNELKEGDQKQQKTLDMERTHNECISIFVLHDQRLTNKAFISESV